MRFTKSQYRLLANYFSGISQGFLLGAFVGQTFAANLAFINRLSLIIFHVSISLLFLYLALVYSKEIDTYE